MTEKNKTTHYEEESKMITNEDKEIGALLGTPFKPVDLPENALDVVKEVLDMVHKTKAGNREVFSFVEECRKLPTFSPPLSI